MTAILGVFETASYAPGERAFCDALSSAFERAGGRVRLHSEPPAILGVAHGAPEAASGRGQPPGFAIDDDFVVLADATLYYTSDLRRGLDGRVNADSSPSQLILSSFRKFGPTCVHHLEGDFAFLIWDRRSREVFCARDFTGRRPLFLVPWRGGLVVATSLDSIAALPGFAPQVDLAAVGADAAGLLFASDDETCMRGVKSLRAGHTVQWGAKAPLVTRRFWHPSAGNVEPLSFDDAAEHLRDLLAAAVTERLSGSGPTAVWMSGGRDSTAVFGAGMYALRGGTSNRELLPVCRSHPRGDSGREDEAIEDIARWSGVTPHWTDAQNVPLFPGLRNRTRWSAEAFAPPFEGLTRALATTGRALGSPVALDGYGGDFLFQVSRVYLSDLVARGRVTTALRDWRVMDAGKEGLRGFFHNAMQPLLPGWATAALSAVRGRSLRASMQRPIPPWIDARFVRENSLAERFASLGPAGQVGPTAVDRETQFYLTHQFFARVNSKMAGFALDEGVELRSPLLDGRVVRFALSRPADERNRAGDHKRLLRAAMRGLLPESVLAPRKAKTGTLASYFAHHMRNEGVRLLTQLPRVTALADAGIVDSAQLARAITHYRDEGSAYAHAESLYCTLVAESWLSARPTDGMSVTERKAGSHFMNFAPRQPSSCVVPRPQRPHLGRAGCPTPSMEEA